jgi:hypothetical protein
MNFLLSSRLQCFRSYIGLQGDNEKRGHDVYHDNDKFCSYNFQFQSLYEVLTVKFLGLPQGRYCTEFVH